MTTNKPISESDALKIAVIVGFEAPKEKIDNFDVSMDECDSREKLDAEIKGWCDECAVFPKSRFNRITSWLDRQAAITSSIVSKNALETIDQLKAENMNLAHDLGECMAECDALKVKVAGDSIKNDGLNCANELNKNEIARLTRKLEKVENEREELRKTLGQVLDAATEIKRIGSFYGVD